MFTGKSRKSKKINLKNIKRAICLIIMCAVMCAGAALSSCRDERPVAMTLTYGDNTTTICSNIYSYYLSYMKTRTLANEYMALGASSVADLQSMGDFPDYWTFEIGQGVTTGDLVKMQAEEALKRMLAMSAYCKEHKLELSKEETNNIDVAIKALIDERYGRSKAALNADLLRFNIDDIILKDIRRLEALTGVFSRHAFDSETGREITDDMINEVYQNTCSRVKHILISTSPGTRDAENNPIEYTEEEMAEIMAKIDDLYERVTTGGEDFDSLLGESEDPGTQANPDGYTVREDTPFVPEFLEAAFDMEIGEVRKVETSYGIHIMKRYELLPANEAVNISTGETWRAGTHRDIQAFLMDDILKPYAEKIEMNRDQTDLFHIESSAVMFDNPELWLS